MVTSGCPEKTLWKMFNPLAAKGERKERLVTCRPNWGMVGCTGRSKGAGTATVSAQRGICSYSQWSKNPAPRVTSQGRFAGAWLLLYLPRESDTAEGGQGMCVLEGGGKGGRKKGEKEEGGGEASPLPASPVPLLTPTEWVAPGIPRETAARVGRASGHSPHFHWLQIVRTPPAR